jgi:hypothetical protein
MDEPAESSPVPKKRKIQVARTVPSSNRQQNVRKQRVIARKMKLRRGEKYLYPS